MSISFAATPQAKEGQQTRAYTDDVSAGAPPSRRTGYDRPYVNRDHWNKVFTQPEYFDSIAKQKGMVEGAKVSLHGDDYVYRQAMMGYLSATRNVPLDDMRSVFDAEKDGFAQKMLGKKTATARELFDWHKTKFERENEKEDAARTVIEDVTRNSLQDAMMGGDTPFVQSVAKSIEATGDLFTEEEKSRLWEKAEEQDKQIRATQAAVAPEARFLFSALGQTTGQQAGMGAPDMREVAGKFAQLPDNQRKAIYELVGGFAQLQQVDKGFWYQMAESLGRGTSDIIERVPRNFREQTLRGQLRLLESEQPVFRATGVAGAEFSAAGSTPATPEEREQAKAKIQSDLGILKVEREIRDLAERVVDPIKTVTFLPEIVEEGLYGAARSVPYTVAAAIPYAGIPAVASALFSANYDRIMLEYPDLDPDKAALIAAASAPIEAVLERLKVNTITGRLPVFGGLVKRLQHPNQRNITRIAIGGVGIVAEQNVQEIVQNATFPFVQTIAAALDQDMPDYDWAKQMENYPRELAVQFVALLPLSLMGMGALSHREMTRGADYIRNKSNLERMGYGEDQIDRITGAATADEAQTILQDEHGKRDPEAVKVAAKRVLDEVLALREEKAPASLPRLEKQGADYVVMQPDGTVITRSTDQTVAEQALVSARRETVQREMRDVHTGINEAVEFIQKVNEARQRGEDIAKVIRENAPRTLLTDYEANPTQENLDRLFETVRAFGQDINEPAELANFPVTGSNQGALREGIWRSIIRINEGADGTIVMREFAQDNLKRAIAEGRTTMDFVRQQLNDVLPQIDSNRIKRQLRTETDTDVIEAFSDVALAYFRGSIREEQIPAGLRGIMRRLAIISRDIFRRAYNLARLRAEGKLDRDFEALLAEAVGVDQQALVDRSRERTEQEVGAGQNYSIALNPSVERALQGVAIGIVPSSLVAVPETKPVPEGMMRRFHVTGLSMVPDILQNGLMWERGRGIEGPKALYSWDNYRAAYSYAHALSPDVDVAIIEHYASPDDYRDNPVATRNNVPPSQFLAIHTPATDVLFNSLNDLDTQERFEYLRNIANTNEGIRQQSKSYADALDAVLEVGKKLDSEGGFQNYSISVTPQQDTDYLAAVERGDMEMAQRMVDDAARAAGYDGGFYHGTIQTKFDVFNINANTRNDFGRFGRGFYFTKDKRTAAVYAGKNPFSGGDFDIPAGATIYSVYLNLRNPKVVDARDVTMPETKEEAQTVAQEIINAGHDGVIGTVVGKIDSPNTEYVVFSSDQIKSADPVTYDADGNVIPLSQRFDATTADINYSIGSPAFQTWFGDSKVVDENGNPLVVFHGTRRPDRVGNRFRKARATSGPMAFFTATADIASSYAEGKADTSLEVPSDYAGWFKYKGKGMRSAVDIDRAWWQMSPEQREAIAQRIYTVGYQNWEESDGPIVGDSQSIMGRDSIDYELRQAKGNALRALVEIWLNSGSLFNDEQMFMQVLEAAGVDAGSVTYDSPNAVKSAVFPVYLSVQNPLDTSNIPADVMSALEQASKRKRAKRSAGANADSWDKNTISGKQWMEVLRLDGGASAWTRIPDWVTETLQALGYDGVLDTGGKMGGPKHQVWIPFEETQVKSATGNRGTFDPTNPNINYSIGSRSEAVDVFDGQSARDLLKSVPANSQFYEVAQTLSELNLPQLDEDKVEINRKRSGAARTSWGSRILSPSDVMGARTVIHEVVHTLTADAIDKYVTNKTRNGQAYVKHLRKVMADSDTPQPIRNLIEVYFATIDRLGLNDDLLGKTIDYVVPAKRKAFGFRRANFGGQEQFYLDYDTKDTELLVDFMREQGVEFSTDAFGDQFVTGEQMQTVAAAAQNAGHRPRFADDFVFLHNFEVTPAKSRRKTTKAFVGQSATKVLKEALQSGVNNPATGKPLTRGQLYGLTNLDEFLAQALSSRDFQELLSSIPAADENRSLWDKLVEAVAKLINWTGSETMLNSALTALSQVAEMQVMSSTSYFGDALIKNDAALDNYSISTQSEIDRVQAAMGALDRSPLSRLKVYEKMQERFLRVMSDNRETLAAMEGGDLSQVRRTQILQALGELDGIISALPTEIRAKIGGYTQLAKVDPMDVFKGDQKVSEVRGMSGAIISAWMREGLNIGQAQKKTELPAGYRAERNLDPTRADRAIADVFIQRINRINEALEKFLRDEYNDAAVELFKRAKPQRSGAGEKPKGKLGATVHELFDTLKEATEWSAEKAQAWADAELMRADSGELNPYDTNHAFMAAHLLRLFGNWANADSTQRASAVAAGLEVLNKAYKGEQQRIIAQRTKRGYDRTDLSNDAGVSAEDDKARQNAVKRENSLPAKWEAAMLNLLNFDQVLRYVFGNDSKIAQKISDRQRKADNVKSDDIAALSDDWASLLTRLGGGEMQGQQLLFDLSRMDEEIDGVSYSQNQLVAITMMWMQPKGRQHMEGFMDSDGQPAGKWHYNQAFVNKAEKLLRPESKVIREYLLLKYDQEYEAINKVYRKVYGLNLPKNQFYSPLIVESINAPAQAGIDPVTGGVFAAGANSPSALRSRGGAVAQPVFRDAVQTYFGHMLQMAHWKAYAEFNGEVSALLGHRDTRNVVKGKAGEQAATVMNNWMQYFQQGGNKDAANHLAINQMINRITGNFAVMALFGRVSTLALQVTQLGAASAKMPVGAYLSRFGKLMSGNLNWKAALDSDYIQRRIKDMPPAVALAMQGLRSDKPSVIREASRRLGQLISGFDGFFTAGTYAIVYDYQLTQAQKNGMGGQEAADYAREATERIVDEIAQPTRAGARSIFEINSTNPVARAVWAFSSEARKNLGLALYAGAKGRSGDFGKAVFYVLILNGLVSTVIRSAFRDLRDDDDDEIFDEKNWGWNRMAAMLISDPLYGFPVVGEAIESGIFNAFGVYTPSGPLFDVAPAVPAVKRMAYDHPMALLEGEAEYRDILRDVNRILSTAGLFNSTIAGAASLTNLAKDSFEVGDNLLGDDE